MIIGYYMVGDTAMPLHSDPEDEIVEVINPKSGRKIKINKTKGIILDSDEEE